MLDPRFLAKKMQLLHYAARLAVAGRPRAAWTAIQQRTLGYAALEWNTPIAHPCRIIIDVGAHTGEVSAALDLAFQPELLLAIEPNPMRVAGFRTRFAEQPHIRVEEAALAEEAGARPFLLHEFAAASSLLSLRPRYLAGLGLPDGSRTIEVVVRRLDQFAVEAGRTEVDLLKTHCQGAELQVLRGAGTLLQRTRCSYAEVSFENLYEGGALFQEMHAFLRAEGFHLVRLEPAAGPHGSIDQGDALYRRNGS